MAVCSPALPHRLANSTGGRDRARHFFSPTNVEQESPGVTVVSSLLNEPLSQNLFPIGGPEIACRTRKNANLAVSSNGRCRNRAQTDLTAGSGRLPTDCFRTGLFAGLR